MSSFRFRLDPLRRLRSHQLERAEARLHRARATQRACDEDALRARSEAATAAQTARAAVGEGLAARALAARLATLEAGHARVAAAAERVERARRRVGDRTRELLEARSRAESLDRLRERHWQRWVRECERAAQRELDEMGRRARGLRR